MEGATYYACALPTMVSDWRHGFPQTAPTPLPFFVVELAAYCNEQDESTFRTFCDSNVSSLTAPDFHLPAMRIAQAASLAVTETYLVSAMDLGSLHPLPYESIHPTNKLEVARRTALGLRHAIFANDTVVYRGPVPVSAAVTGLEYVTIRFDLQLGAGGLALNASAACPSVVLNVYCRRALTHGFEVEVGGQWMPPRTVDVDSPTTVVIVFDPSGEAPTRVRYAYSDWPVVSLRNAVGGLPARLFDVEVTK